MIYVVISVLTMCLPLIVALMWAIVALYRETQRTRISVGDAVSAALTEQHAVHAAQIESLHLFYRASLTAIGNTVQFGNPAPPPAEIDHEPTPEQALGRMIDEDTVARGVEALRREYAAAGVTVTDEELRNDVLAIITDQPLTVPASVRGLVDPPMTVPLA